MNIIGYSHELLKSYLVEAKIIAQYDVLIICKYLRQSDFREDKET